MPKRRDLVAEQLQQLADDLEELWRALTRDPKAERRKERAWTMLLGGLGAASTIASRQLVARLWGILTGEQPPTARAKPQPRRRTEPAEREDVGTPAR
jgi:hypothetical protein